jgi:hypothetical protein
MNRLNLSSSRAVVSLKDDGSMDLDAVPLKRGRMAVRGQRYGRNLNISDGEFFAIGSIPECGWHERS